MKKLLIFFYFLIAYISAEAQLMPKTFKQIEKKESSKILRQSLKVYSITEYIDIYIIKAVDTLKNDTLNIVSKKEKGCDAKKYKKIIVGNNYDFEYEDPMSNGGPVQLDHYFIRVNKDILWRVSDGKATKPFFAQNLKGAWIKK